MDNYFDWIKGLILEYAYLTIFLGLVLENTIFLGFIFPGVLILVFSGFIAATGELNVFLCVLVAFCGAVVGDNLSFFLGRLAKKMPIIERVVEKNQKLKDKINSENPYLLVFFQFPVYMRVLMPVTLGSMQYPFRRWIVIDLIASVLFSSTFIGLGFVIARTSGLFATATTISNYVQYVFVVIFLIWVLNLIYFVFKKKN